MAWIRLHWSIVTLVLITASGAFWPLGDSLLVRLSLAWGIGVTLFLIVSLLKMRRNAEPERIRRRAAELDDAGPAITPFALLAAVASLIAVIGSAASSPRDGEGQSVIGLGTVALSWVFVHLIFALHYAHAFYAQGQDGEDRGGLLFPGNEPPDYWDFLHFSLIIGVASQTADIQIADKGLRRLSTLHSVTAFVFNTVIVALAVNLAVGLLGR